VAEPIKQGMIAEEKVKRHRRDGSPESAPGKETRGEMFV
jgi:hypothetical protein